MGRLAVCVAGLIAALPALAAAEPAPQVALPRSDLGTSIRSEAARQRFPADLPRVAVDDATPPPQLRWNPNAASFVKIVPVKVRYRLTF